MPTRPPPALEPYDLNFCFPVREVLETERVKIVPFIPHKHADAFFAASSIHESIYTYLPLGPYKNVEEFLDVFIKGRVQGDPGFTLFAIFDKTKAPDSRAVDDETHEGALAGLISYLDASPVNLCTEIGFITILPPFQRTHVTSNAVGLLLHYALDLPAAGGLGLRRVAWKANAMNKPSLRAADRMGFKKEGILRWDQVLPVGKVGNGALTRVGESKEGCPGRDTAILSICWDDWEGGIRDHVDALMNRKE